MTPLQLKLKRAEHHLQDFTAVVQPFLDQPLQPTESTARLEGKSYRVLRVEALRPPDEISVIFGDFLQNLRASLDYLVGALRPAGPSERSAFPICTRRPTFLRESKVKLDGVPVEAMRLIERMQPYDRRFGRPRRERVRWEALALLDKLWNIDKHRTLLLVYSWPKPEGVGHNRGDDSGIRFRMRSTFAEIWLPIDDRDQHYEPRFGLELHLARPQSFRDWPDIDDWEADGIAHRLHEQVRWNVLPFFSRWVAV
jgi:hypothetical protein